MRHTNYVLTPKAIDAAKPRETRYTLTDGGGLHIEVMPSGSKVWRFKYHLEGKREKVTVGAYPEVSVKAARDRHEKLRELVEQGQSPARAKQGAIADRKVAAEQGVTFREFSVRWIDETLFYRSASYRAQITRWLNDHVYPAIGDMPIGDVQPGDILAIIDPLVKTPTTADRVRVIIQQVYNFAIRKLLVTVNPAAALRGAIVVPPKTHHPHLVGPQIGTYWRLLGVQQAHATTIAAARLLLLTMVRKNELQRAQWSEFNGDVWDIPAERMKMKLKHRVFLSRQAVQILEELRPLTGPVGYVLPSIYRRTVPMGDSTLNHLLGRMDLGMESFSPHGLRGTAATLLREKGVGRDVVELLLAHTEGDSTVAAYSHHELVEERRAALQLLADEVERLAATA